MTQSIRLLLRDLRQERDLSQEELARALNVSRQSIISLEQGAYLPSAPLLVALMEFFNCSIEELVEGIKISKNINQIQEGGEQRMQLTPWSPFQAIDHLHDEMNEMVEKTFGRVDWPRTLGTVAGAMNIHENEKEYEIEVQVPGYKEDEINIELTEDTLSISGEHKTEEKTDKKNLVRREWEHSQFARSIRFASPIKEKDVEAKLENGTLMIVAPKVEPIKPKTTKISVKKTK
jgi:HSP20 family protein